MPSRDRILDAVVELIRERGLARTTTKEIALAAGVSEGTIYKQFRDKQELIGHVLRDRMPEFVPALKDLGAAVGENTVRDNLIRLATLAIEYYRDALPITAALFADPELLAAQRQVNRAAGAGPQRAQELLAAYLSVERDLGRVPGSADPRSLAKLLLGGCFHQAFLESWTGERRSADAIRELATELVDALLPDS